MPTRHGPRTLTPPILAALLCAAAPAFAVEAELSSQNARLSGGFESQSTQALRLAWRGESERLLQVVFERKQAFGENASLAVVSLAQDLSADARAGAALALSDAQTIAARRRIDAFYSHKLLPQRNLVATLAGFAAQVADGHRLSLIHI